MRAASVTLQRRLVASSPHFGIDQEGRNCEASGVGFGLFFYLCRYYNVHGFL